MVVQNSFLIFKEYAYNKKQDTRSHKQISCTIFIHLTSLKRFRCDRLRLAALIILHVPCDDISDMVM